MEIFKLKITDSQKYFSRLSSSGGTMAAFYTIIELNKYFLIVAIKLYSKVMELKDPSAANMVLSNDFGRKPTYYVIMNALILRNATSVYPCDYKSYAAQLEVIIVDLQDRIYSMVKQFNGTFAKHPIVLSRVYSRNDFEEHARIVKESEINYGEAWKIHRTQLLSANEYFKKLPKKTKNQQEIHDLVAQLLLDKQPKPSTHVGDLIISLDSPSNATVIAHDKIFNTICPALSKDHIYIGSLLSIYSTPT